MKLVLLRLLLPVSMMMFGIVVASAADVEHYRDFRLGSPVAAVTAVTTSPASAITTVHERPALLQQLVWNPRYTTGRTVPESESVRQVTFGFIDDQLFSIAVQYEPRQTTGLTDEDMIAALSKVYGTRMPATPLARRRPGQDPYDAPTTIAQWSSTDAAVALTRSEYGAYELLVTSPTLEPQARTARASAVAIDAREAPAREAARRQKAETDERAAAEKTRTTNRDKFTP